MADRFAVLYKKYGPLIYARCRRILGDDADAEDATQEVFLRVAAHLDQAPTSKEALLWIYRIATNHCLNEIRNSKRRPRTSDVPVEEQHLGTVGGEDDLANRDLARRVVEQVPEHMVACALLHHVNGMSHTDVGQTLGTSRRTIFTYLAAFQQRARKLLGRESW